MRARTGNYAAAGGSDQRAYPWSVPAASLTISCSYANSNAGGDGTNVHCVNDMLGGVQNVGLDTLGDGKVGAVGPGRQRVRVESRLAGERLRRAVCRLRRNRPGCRHGSPCARRCGVESGASNVRTSFRGGGVPEPRVFTLGIRCARPL